MEWVNLFRSATTMSPENWGTVAVVAILSASLSHLFYKRSLGLSAQEVTLREDQLKNVKEELRDTKSKLEKCETALMALSNSMRFAGSPGNIDVLPTGDMPDGTINP